MQNSSHLLEEFIMFDQHDQRSSSQKFPSCQESEIKNSDDFCQDDFSIGTSIKEAMKIAFDHRPNSLHSNQVYSQKKEDDSDIQNAQSIQILVINTPKKASVKNIKKSNSNSPQTQKCSNPNNLTQHQQRALEMLLNSKLTIEKDQKEILQNYEYYNIKKQSKTMSEDMIAVENKIQKLVKYGQKLEKIQTQPPRSDEQMIKYLQNSLAKIQQIVFKFINIERILIARKEEEIFQFKSKTDQLSKKNKYLPPQKFKNLRQKSSQQKESGFGVASSQSCRQRDVCWFQQKELVIKQEAGNRKTKTYHSKDSIFQSPLSLQDKLSHFSDMILKTAETQYQNSNDLKNFIQKQIALKIKTATSDLVLAKKLLHKSISKLDQQQQEQPRSPNQNQINSQFMAKSILKRRKPEFIDLKQKKHPLNKKAPDQKITLRNKPINLDIISNIKLSQQIANQKNSIKSQNQSAINQHSETPKARIINSAFILNTNLFQNDPDTDRNQNQKTFYEQTKFDGIQSFHNKNFYKNKKCSTSFSTNLVNRYKQKALDFKLQLQKEAWQLYGPKQEDGEHGIDMNQYYQCGIQNKMNQYVQSKLKGKNTDKKLETAKDIENDDSQKMLERQNRIQKIISQPEDMPQNKEIKSKSTAEIQKPPKQAQIQLIIRKHSLEKLKLSENIIKKTYSDSQQNQKQPTFSSVQNEPKVQKKNTQQLEKSVQTPSNPSNPSNQSQKYANKTVQDTKQIFGPKPQQQKQNLFGFKPDPKLFQNNASHPRQKPEFGQASNIFNQNVRENIRSQLNYQPLNSQQFQRMNAFSTDYQKKKFTGNQQQLNSNSSIAQRLDQQLNPSAQTFQTFGPTVYVAGNQKSLNNVNSNDAPDVFSSNRNQNPINFLKSMNIFGGNIQTQKYIFTQTISNQQQNSNKFLKNLNGNQGYSQDMPNNPMNMLHGNQQFAQLIQDSSSNRPQQNTNIPLDRYQPRK